MTARYGSLLLLAVAGGLYFGIARPRQTEATAAADEYQRLRGERRKTRTQLSAQRQQEARRQKVREAIAGGQGQSLSGVRRTVLASLKDAPLRALRLEVRSARAPAGARVHVGGEGSLIGLASAAARIAAPGTGLAFEHVTLDPAAAGARLEVDAFAVVQP